ncbi:hypothetical protein ScPMuIL_007474 [Solemya velum]
MLSNRRLAKRSIIGTKVSAQRQDGYFHPGVIDCQLGEVINGVTYLIRFDDGQEKSVHSKWIVGPGFQQVTDHFLERGQCVYTTLNGREVCGGVVKHDPGSGDVCIGISLPTGESIEVTRKLEEVRLLKSRKSARLVDQDTDYSKLADIHSNHDIKRRTVSHVIDVPNKSRLSQVPLSDIDEGQQDEEKLMDESIAALVLTSLSGSPASPHFPSSFKDLSPEYEDYHFSSSVSSGFLSSQSERNDESSPFSTHLSTSAPASSGVMLFASFSNDEGIDLDEDETHLYDVESKEKQLESQTKTLYQCTWPRCSRIQTTCSEIEKHIRAHHLGLTESDSNTFGHEEEFYYTEIEVNLDNVTKTFSEMSTSSPPKTNDMDLPQPIIDHDYQRKDHQYQKASSVPFSCGFAQQKTTPIPINIPQIKRSLSWQNNSSSPSQLSSPTRMLKPSPQERLQQHLAQSPKSHMLSSPPKPASNHKKSRGDVRKCRKVYGMENKDMWCTQCKWKKACTRFLD